ncbi:MAG: DNA-binding response regulator [Actinobacteria bacterium RBG_16_67_15]|nr:MAG: DNA-binding response regulator [Actinobacteria bacterium RBG_16_67_15]
MIRVAVVDDHTVMRQGLVGLLEGEPDVEVVGEAGDAETALAMLQATTPDVALIDIGLPGTSGVDLTAQVKLRVPGVAVLIVTMHEREDYLFQALRAGASGYVLKGADVRDLLAAVRTVASGETYVSQKLTGNLVGDYLRRVGESEDSTDYDGLSEREVEILRLIAEGLTTPEIGAALHVSPHTVQSHRDHIMTKLDLHSRVALTKYAIRKGLIQLDP